LNKVKTLARSFREFSIKQVPRSENKKTDALSKIASTSFAHLSKQVLVEELEEKSINEKEILAVVEEEGNTWMTPIYEYITKEILPADKKKARAVRRKAASPSPRPKKAAIKLKSSCGTTLSADLVYQGKLYQTMENSSATTHSKIGVKNYVSVNALLP
ncbi:hypothetical protein Tco_0480370, partial [Tanacetum coccineum]